MRIICHYTRNKELKKKGKDWWIRKNKKYDAEK